MAFLDNLLKFLQPIQQAINPAEQAVSGFGKTLLSSLTQPSPVVQAQPTSLNLMQFNQPAPITPQAPRPQMPMPQPAQAFKQYQPVQNMNLGKDFAGTAANVVALPFGGQDQSNTVLGHAFKGEFSQIPQAAQSTAADINRNPQFWMNTITGMSGHGGVGLAMKEVEPFQGIRTSSTAEDMANMVPGKSQAKFINGGKPPLINESPSQMLGFKPPEPQPVVPPKAPVTPDQGPIANPQNGFDNSGFKQAFADWVGGKQAIPVEKAIVSKRFGNLAGQGIDAFHAIQQGDTSNPAFGDVRNYLDTKFAQATAAGHTFGYQPDYLPQMWNNTPEEISKVFGSSIMNRPGFTQGKLIEDYATGIKAGLTPKFNNIPDLLSHYEGQVNKAVADRGFVNYLGKNNLISPTQGAPKGWKMLDPEHFPRMKINVGQAGQEAYSEGPFSAPPQVADMINNNLTNPKSGSTFERGLAKIADFTSSAKNKALSFGVPKTAINAHGYNTMVRHTLFGTGGNPISRFVTAGKYMLAPGEAGKFFDSQLENAPQAVKDGLKLGTEDHNVLGNDATLRNKFGEAWNNAFEKPLFGKMIPALKLSTYQNLVQGGMEGRQAAALTNNTYGGINWEQMGRDKNIQNFLRAVVLAPDWAESNLRLGGNIAKSFVKGGPTANRYRTMAATLIGSYVTANVANKMSSGHYMWQNDPGHTMEIESGYTKDGTKRYFNVFGTGADFAKIPYEIVQGLATGNPSIVFTRINNRLSIPVNAALALAKNSDYRGKPIYGQDQYGNKMTPLQSAEGIGSQIAQGVGLPSFIKQAADTATGKQGLEQGATQGLELPLRYTASPTSKTGTTVKGVAQAEGQSGKQLYDTIHSSQGQTFSKNQQQLIQQGGSKVIQPILDLKNANKQIKNAKAGLTSDTGQGTVQAAQPQAPITNLKVTSSPPAIAQVNPTDLALAKAKMKLNQPLTTQEQQALQGSQQGAVNSSQYSLNNTRDRQANDAQAFVQDTQSRIDYLGSLEKSLNPQTDQAKILSTQNQIESLTAQKDKVLQNGYITKPKSGKKVSTSKILSAFKFKSSTPKSYRVSSSLHSAVSHPAIPKLPQIKAPKLAAFRPAKPKLTAFSNKKPASLTKYHAL